MKKHKLLITGGNGFVGHNICRLAGQHNISIISISRSGPPKEMNVRDYTTVEWVTADIFNHSSWKTYMEQCTAVIHTIGIVEEQPEKGITYERMIYQSAKVVADTAREAGVKKFVFISAGAAAPETPHTYMQAKQKAEAYLELQGMELVILKPGMIYGQERPGTTEEAAEILKLLSDPVSNPVLGSNRPLNVLVVANAALESAVNNTILGKLDVDAMEKMMNQAKSYENK